ncbi:MAG: hypothetical protein PHU85_10275 [Phycisphaerae bacterium]|nr:hypothetical protein [Phycisphaerae bacterium]
MTDQPNDPKYLPVDLSAVRTYSQAKRQTKVDPASVAGLPAAGATTRELLDSLPDFLAARHLRQLADAIATAHRAGRPVGFAFGAHVVKVGCSPIVCDLIERGVISAVATNGAGAIHDLELAMFGATSEDVAANLADGSFGMVAETPAAFAEILAAAKRNGRGLGRNVGEFLLAKAAPHAKQSIFAAAARAGIPAAVSTAIGTDTIHMHPNVDPAEVGRASGVDFRILCRFACDLDGGVWINAGSAVIMPEVFLKVITVARNLGHALDGLTTANLDMIRHYRPGVNVTGRPVAAGRGLTITGHHEILLPLLRMAVLERLAR